MKTFHEIVMGRRTCKNFNGQEVKRSDLEQLLEWAVNAPNHRLNQPWYFRVFERSGVQKLLGGLSPLLAPADLKALQGSIDKMSQIGALIYVSSKNDSDAHIHAENLYACSAAVENILLGASSLGIESFWSTGKLMKHPAFLEAINWKPDETFVGALWLGYGDKPAAKARRPLSEVSRWWS